jgi:alkylated DNA nucleotide flippase Atl1
MNKKSFNEKLYDSKDLPKIIDLSDKIDFVKRYGGNKMVVAPAIDYNEVIKKIPEGKLITTDRIRQYISKKYNVDVTCPLTAGIFINICAHASEERDNDKIPYWRVLKSKGELNEKYPFGIDGQKLLLELEGFEIIKKGNKYFVKDYEEKLIKL